MNLIKDIIAVVSMVAIAFGLPWFMAILNAAWGG